MYLNGSNATKNFGGMNNSLGVHHMSHSDWEDKGFCSPSYTNHSSRLKFTPTRTTDAFDKIGYSWNVNGKRNSKLC